MFSPDVITDKRQVTVPYLRCVFETSGVGQGNKVISVREITSRTSFRSSVNAFDVTWQDNTDRQVPHRILLKLAQADVRGMPWELRMYKEFAPIKGDVPVVRCFDGQFDVARNVYHLLLEDVSLTHQAVDSRIPPTPTESEAIVQSLGMLHRSWWGHEALTKIAEEYTTEFQLRRIGGFFQSHVSELLVRLGDRLTIRERSTIEKIAVGAMSLIEERISEVSNLTLVHGDAHTLNFLMPRMKQGTAIIVDWQLAHWNLPTWCGVSDIAYFLVHSFSPRRRQVLEDHLLAIYRQTLAEVPQTYSTTELFDDYRRSMLVCLMTTVHRAFMSDSRAWYQPFEHCLTAIQDLECTELIPG